MSIQKYKRKNKIMRKILIIMFIIIISIIWIIPNIVIKNLYENDNEKIAKIAINQDKIAYHFISQRLKKDEEIKKLVE